MTLEHTQQSIGLGLIKEFARKARTSPLPESSIKLLWVEIIEEHLIATIKEAN